MREGGKNGRIEGERDFIQGENETKRGRKSETGREEK
jgi:hypothetical protein